LRADNLYSCKKAIWWINEILSWGWDMDILCCAFEVFLMEGSAFFNVQKYTSTQFLYYLSKETIRGIFSNRLGIFVVLFKGLISWPWDSEPCGKIITSYSCSNPASGPPALLILHPNTVTIMQLLHTPLCSPYIVTLRLLCFLALPCHCTTSTLTLLRSALFPPNSTNLQLLCHPKLSCISSKIYVHSLSQSAYNQPYTISLNATHMPLVDGKLMKYLNLWVNARST